LDKNTPQFDELLGYLAAAITVFTLKTIGPLQAIIVGFLMYHAHTWIAAFRHSRKQIDNTTVSPLSSGIHDMLRNSKRRFCCSKRHTELLQETKN